MRLSRIFPFRRNRRVYALPTPLGILLFALIGVAIWEFEQWLSILMVILALFHLADCNEPFGELVIEVQPFFDPPFCGRVARIPVSIHNPSSFPSVEGTMRIQGSDRRVEMPMVPPHSSARVFLEFVPSREGRQKLARVSVSIRPRPGFFHLWSLINDNIEFVALPAPVDHGVACVRAHAGLDEERSLLEEIHDPRLLPRRDHKLFLKTGRSFLRAAGRAWLGPRHRLDWRALNGLGESERRQQFSFWLEQADRPDRLVEVATPFVAGEATLRYSDLKRRFADWVGRGA